jgi:endogenous inhibitor of DNA gyrase (YacG/DUF329 family)
MRVKCPTCRREMDWSPDNAFRPFCSERCRLIDLGAWFTEGRAIAGDPAQPEDGDALPDAGQREGEA